MSEIKKKKYVYGVRRQCFNCHTRIYKTKMYYIHFPLLNKAFWVCCRCYHLHSCESKYLTDEERTFQSPLPAPLFL